MPEIITKYPEKVLKVLNSANIQCGVGEKQTILSTCPPDRFCKLPTGELCIYGVSDVSKMSQIHFMEFFLNREAIIPLIALLVMAFTLGMLAGIRLGNKKKA